MTATRVAIHGATGRMGQRLIALGWQDDQIELVAALESPEHPKLGEDVGLIAGIGSIGLPVTSELDVSADAVIDFSVPDAAAAITATCQDRGTALVLATTGLSDAQNQLVQDAAATIPIVMAPNMSAAVNLTMKLAEAAGEVLKQLPSGVDVEILERHHRFKEDAPSGTALKFGQIISNMMGQSIHTHGRQGHPGVRPRNEIGYHALRVGDNPGEHTIVFGMLGETIELTVRATNRDCYALGALSAARFVAGQSPGIYSMADVLGFS